MLRPVLFEQVPTPGSQRADSNPEAEARGAADPCAGAQEGAFSTGCRVRRGWNRGRAGGGGAQRSEGPVVTEEVQSTPCSRCVRLRNGLSCDPFRLQRSVAPVIMNPEYMVPRMLLETCATVGHPLFTQTSNGFSPYAVSAEL